MVDIDSEVPLTQLYPRLRYELKRLQVEVTAKMVKRSTDVGNIGQLKRQIAILCKNKQESVFSAAARVWRSDMVNIDPVVAIAAAIELTAETVNPSEGQ